MSGDGLYHYQFHYPFNLGQLDQVSSAILLYFNELSLQELC